MDPNYEFDAPMYVDFRSTPYDDGVDTWFDFRTGDEGGVVIEDDYLEETAEENTVPASETFVVQQESKPEETMQCKNITATIEAKETFQDSNNENENIPVNANNEKTADPAPEPVKPARILPSNICASSEEWRQKTKGMRRIGGHSQPLKAVHPVETMQIVKQGREEKQKEKHTSKTDPNTKKNDRRSQPVLNARRSVRIAHKRNLSSSSSHSVMGSSMQNRVPTPMSNSRIPSPCTSSRKRDPSPAPCPSQRGQQPSPSKTRGRQPSPCSNSRSRQLSTCSNASLGNSFVSPQKKRKTTNASKSRTIPTLPSMMRRANNNPVNHKSKEDEELEIIAKLQEETKKKIEQNEQFMKKALSAQPYMPYRSVEDNLTFPEEFHFATDERIKSVHKQEEKRKDFVETLRQHPPSPTFKNRGPTVPVPFHFHATSGDSRKRKLDEEEDKPTNSYVTMAQHIYNFQIGTPERFRSKSIKDQNGGPTVIQNKAPLKVTHPRTPKLLSRERKRPMTDGILTRDQEEEKIAEEMKNYRFKATKFDPRIIETNGCYGIKTVPKKPVTEPQPFSFEYDQRAELHRQKEQMTQEPKQQPFKANPVPDFDQLAFKPELKHKASEVKPFSFEERNKEMLEKKVEKIQATYEEEKKAREFQAQPLPSFSPPKLQTNSKQLTEPAPFNLSCDYKGAAKAEKWIQKVREELKEERMKAVFKAHSSNVLYNGPFVPKKSLKPATEFDEFDLNTERRREAREIYDMAKQERDKAVEAEALQREKEREEEERVNLIDLRKQLVHKSNPIRKFTSVKIQPSQQPLTLPESPAWTERRPKKMRV